MVGAAISFYEFNLDELSLESARSLLSVDELKRLATYRLELFQRRFAVGRGLLRTILGQWIGTEPALVPIRLGAHGKPETDGIFFNLSHADDKMILVISEKGPVGVDIEKYDDRAWPERVEDFFLSTQEKLFLAKIPLLQRERYFFSLWTMKEAYLKEKGCGLIADLCRIDTKDLNFGTHWHSLPVEAAYIAYLATSYEVSYVTKNPCGTARNNCII